MTHVTTLEDIFGLRGHRAIVTGASSGLGVEFAEALALAGADVALIARRADRLEDVARRLEPCSVTTAVVPADLSDVAAIPEVFARAEAALGPIDILINNAGMHDPQRAEKVTRERWSRLLEVITVNTLAPGYFPTDLTAKDFEKPEIRARAETFVPLGRLGQPGELRAALLFLVSPASAYVTGSTVFVDGGYTAW